MLDSNKDIITRLQFNYDGLTNDDRKCMFVDIACIILGHSKNIALGGCG